MTNNNYYLVVLRTTVVVYHILSSHYSSINYQRSLTLIFYRACLYCPHFFQRYAVLWIEYNLCQFFVVVHLYMLGQWKINFSRSRGWDNTSQFNNATYSLQSHGVLLLSHFYVLKFDVWQDWEWLMLFLFLINITDHTCLTC